MASEKRPSIYDDRSTIGSSSELDEYGVWVKSEPQEFSAPTGDFPDPLDPAIDMLPDFGISEGGTVSLEEGDLELPDMGIPDDFANVPLNAETGALDLDSFNIGDEEDSLPELDDTIFSSLDASEEASNEGGDGEPAGEEDFNEISLEEFLGNLDGGGGETGEQEVSSGFPEEETPELRDEGFSASLTATEGKAQSAMDTDASTQLLAKIVGELSSIRVELSTLKQEVFAIRANAPAAEGETAGGFFDPEADEKIALTGDEFDTIINTADFTGESGAGTSISMEPEEDQISEEELNIDLSALNLDEPALAEFKEEDFIVPMDKTAQEIPVDQDEVLDQLREMGAQPLSPAPENTSYLDEDPLAPENLDLGSLDLGETATEEPDISLELPAIDLDLEEAENSVSPNETGGEEETAPEDSLEISLDSFPGLNVFDTGEELIPEGFVVETDSLPAEDGIVDEETVYEDTDSLTMMEEPQEIKKIRKSAQKSRVSPLPQTDNLDGIPPAMTEELRAVLSYMDHLLESLPQEKIDEFGKSEYFITYKKLFKELGIK